MKQINLFKTLSIIAIAMTSYNVYRACEKGKVYHAVLSQIEAIANGEIVSGGTNCTATYTCVDTFGTPNGSVSCTGSVCKRGIETEGVIFITEKRYVECDGKRTYC